MADDELFLGFDAAFILGDEPVEIFDADAFGTLFVHQVQHNTLQDLRVSLALHPFVAPHCEFRGHPTRFLVVVAFLEVVQQSCAYDCRPNRKNF